MHQLRQIAGEEAAVADHRADGCRRAHDDTESVSHLGTEACRHGGVDHQRPAGRRQRVAGIQCVSPPCEIARAGRKPATAPFELWINDKRAVLDHFVRQAQRVLRTGISLHQPRNPSSGLRDDARQLQRVEESSRNLVVGLRASNLFEHHREHDVVGVRVLPALTRRKRRRGVEEIRELVFRFPHPVWLCAKVGRECRIHFVTHETTRVRHQVADGDISRVGQSVKPRVFAEIRRDLGVKIETPCVDQLHRERGEERLAGAAGEEEIVDRERRARRTIRKACRRRVHGAVLRHEPDRYPRRPRRRLPLPNKLLELFLQRRRSRPRRLRRQCDRHPDRCNHTRPTTQPPTCPSAHPPTCPFARS